MRVFLPVIVTCAWGALLGGAPTIRAQVLAAAAAKNWQAALQLVDAFHMSSDPELQGDPELFGAVSAVLIRTGHEALYRELITMQTGGFSASSAFQLATWLAKDGLFVRAIEMFERIPLTDRDEAVFFNLALAQSHAALFDEARRNYFQAIDLHPALKEAYFHIGLDYANAGNLNSAVPWMLKTLQLDPENVEVFCALSEELLSLGFTDTVAGMLRTAPASQSSSPFVKIVQGELSLALGNLSAARLAFEQALSLDPRSVPALIGRGRVAMRESDNKAARKFFEQAFSLDPSSPAGSELGRMDYRNGDNTGAARHFKAACRATCSEETRIEFVRSLLASGEPQEALEILEQRKTEENPGTTHYLLSLIFRKLGRAQDAERELHLSQRQNDLSDTTLRFDAPKVYVQ